MQSYKMRRGYGAVHRWFKDGEGWAYHPRLKGNLRKIVVALDQVLKSSQDRSFCIPVGSHFLVGERIADEHCLDPKAARRKPFIIRSALISWNPSESERQEIGEQLKAVVPVERGEDASMLFEFSPLLELAEPTAEHEEQRPAVPMGTAVTGRWPDERRLNEMQRDMKILEQERNSLRKERDIQRIQQTQQRARTTRAWWFLVSIVVLGELALVCFLILDMYLDQGDRIATYVLIVGLFTSVVMGISGLVFCRAPRPRKIRDTR